MMSNTVLQGSCTTLYRAAEMAVIEPIHSVAHSAFCYELVLAHVETTAVLAFISL